LAAYSITSVGAQQTPTIGIVRGIGLVPRQDSTGGRQKLGPISKQGDRYLRRILIVGAHNAVIRSFDLEAFRPPQRSSLARELPDIIWSHM
jgi:hypothetical protein